MDAYTMEYVTMTGVCVFCGSEGPLGREHVYGQWLSKIGVDLSPQQYYASPLNEIPRDMGHQPPFRQTVKNVCLSCNNGWMSKLEVIARRVLTPLIRGESATVTVDDQPAVAMWVQKTALTAMLISSEAQRKNGYGLPPKLYHELYKRHGALEPLQPSQFWIGRYAGDPAFHAVQVTPMAVRIPDIPEPAVPQAYLMTIVIGALFIQCLLFINDAIAVEMTSDLKLQLLWPSNDDIQWPFGQLCNSDEFTRAADGMYLKSTVDHVTLEPWSVATQLSESVLEDGKIKVPALCGKHYYYYPASLCQAAIQGHYYAFVTCCECGHCYLIQLERDGAHCKAYGSADEIARIYDAMTGEEISIVDSAGVFFTKLMAGSNAGTSV